MARSFWGFGYSGTQNAPEKPVKLSVPPSSIAPPVGTFATPTTAITPAQPDIAATTQPPGSVKTQITLAAGGSRMPSLSSSSKIQIPANATIQGTLRVRVLEGRHLNVSSNTSKPYVVVNCSTSEHISRSAKPGGSQLGQVGSRLDLRQFSIDQQSVNQNSANKNFAFSSQNTHAPGSGSGAGTGAGTGASAISANPSWEDEAYFDVTSYGSDVEINVYDAGDADKFLGRISIHPDFDSIRTRPLDQWYRLQPRNDEQVHGEIHISVSFQRLAPQHHFGPQDFTILRLIGKGTFGQVYQVRKKDSNRIYAMKVLSKRLIVQRKEIAHTIGERDILVRTSGDGATFLVGLKFSFQTASDLYLVTDYMSGGELFWHLQREGRFSEKRAKFYIAELIVALQHLHDNDIVYRDLKPENILLDASGHIALCDFGLSKANLSNGTTNTFCGTTEYLAPEVLLDDKGYTKMVDFWSLGVLIFEMCCGWSPFYAEDNQQMYKNIAFGKVRFPKDALSPEGRDFVKGLLNRNPLHRLGATDDARELMQHAFFKDIDWTALKKKQVTPPYKPQVSSDDDTSNFDPEFTSASTSVITRGMEGPGGNGTVPLSPGIQDKFKGFTYVDDTLMDEYFKGKDARAPLSASFRAPPPSMGRDEAIDLYDENEIKMSHNYYDSSLKNKFQSESRHNEHEDNLMQTDEVDELMMDDDRENYDDFVEGQGFEM